MISSPRPAWTRQRAVTSLTAIELAAWQADPMPQIAIAPGVHPSPGGLGAPAHATERSRGGTLTPRRDGRGRHTGIVTRVGTTLIAAISLLLAGCGGVVYCSTCPGLKPVVQIFGVRPDPERVLRVCADIGRPCVELRITEAEVPSYTPSPAVDRRRERGIRRVRETAYSCVVSDET